jgi:hypothetical protein
MRWLAQKLKDMFSPPAAPEDIEDNPFYRIFSNPDWSEQEKMSRKKLLLDPRDDMETFKRYSAAYMRYVEYKEQMASAEAEKARQVSDTVEALSGGGLDQPLEVGKPLTFRPKN